MGVASTGAATAEQIVFAFVQQDEPPSGLRFHDDAAETCVQLGIQMFALTISGPKHPSGTACGEEGLHAYNLLAGVVFEPVNPRLVV